MDKRYLIKELFPSMSLELQRNSRLTILIMRRQSQRKRQTMGMSASRSRSARVPAWRSPDMEWTMEASNHSLKSWRACYAEHHRIEQVLLHQELHGHALQVQQDIGGDPSSVRQGTGTRRSVHRDVKEQEACPSVLVRQDFVQSLLEAVCTGI